MKEEEIYFSVIVPLYNKENDVANTIHSVLNQKYLNFEIVVINDGSTDDSQKEVEKFSDNRIRIFNTDNNGLPSARNLGVKYSRYNYLAFLDADDFWLPNHLSTLKILIESFPGNAWYGTSYSIIYRKNLELPSYLYKKWDEGWQGEIKNFFLINTTQWLVHICSICVRKEYFLQIGGFNEKLDFEEDIDFYIRIAMLIPLIYSNTLTLRYNMLGENRISDSRYNDKVGVDLDEFKKFEGKILGLKQFLDFFRYTQYLKFKMAGDHKKAFIAKAGVSNENLTLTQRLLLKMPRFLLLLFWRFKELLAGFNINFRISRK